ncbi:MAG: aminopeptidase P family N-terminal domain-containing protein, partial [Longimicrobiales bacterium]
MISRRTFLGASTVGFATAAVHGADALLAETPEALSRFGAPGSPDALQDPLPPSIERLTSQRSRATPITAAERANRIERARSLMRANKLDALLLTGGTSTVYFTGINWWVSER